MSLYWNDRAEPENFTDELQPVFFTSVAAAVAAMLGALGILIPLAAPS